MSGSTPTALFVGTFTQRLPHVDGKAKGLFVHPYRDGAILPGKLAARIESPSYLVLGPTGERLYVISETWDYEDSPGGSVVSFRWDPQSLTLEHINTQPVHAGLPDYLDLDPAGQFLLVSNYSGSISVFRIESDGSIGEKTEHICHSGWGPNRTRQQWPHPHMVAFVPGTRDLIVPDLGIDAIFTYALTDDGKLVEREQSRIRTTPGTGPRHVVFHANGRHAFLLNELGNSVTVLRKEDGRFVVHATFSTVVSEGPIHTEAGAILISASGRHVFATNRGDDTVAMFAFDEASGDLSLVQLSPAAGTIPRDLLISPDGRLLHVANQNSNSIATFEIDEERGRLTHLSNAASVTPACLVFG